MPGLDYSQLTKDELVRLCVKSAYTIDGLWFLAIEQKYGLATAVELDAGVWQEATKIHLRRLLKSITIKEDSPIQVVTKLIQDDPLLLIFNPQVVSLTDNRAVIRCPDCPPQRARIRSGQVNSLVSQ